MDSAVSTILIAVVILVVVFLILREVNCWYWKINERISLQKDQNSILEKILLELKNEPKSEYKSSSQKKGEDKNLEKSLDEVEEEKDSMYEEITYGIELTSEESSLVDEFIKFGIKPGERLVINKTTRKIDRFEEKEWKNVDQNEWVILFEN